MTMSSDRVQSLIDRVAQKKMAELEGTIGSMTPGNLSPEGLCRFPNSQPVQYSGAYFTCEPRLQDRANLPPLWSPSNGALLNGRNTMMHSPGTKDQGQNHIVYRADNLQFPTEGNHAPTVQDLPPKHGFTYYTRSSGMRSPSAPGVAAPVSVRNHAVGSGNISQTSGNSVCLAIPKPIYGHSPCCSELAYSVRPRYNVEHVPQRVDSNVYEEDWVLYSQRALLHGNNPAFMQQRAGQLDCSAERIPLRDIAVEAVSLSPNGKKTLPAFIEPNYMNYSCTPTRPLVRPSNEQCQHLQIPSKAFHGLYPFHPPTYKHMSSLHLGGSSQLYQHPSPMSKYGHLTQQHMFYYPEANVGEESRVAYKDVGEKYREEGDPSVHKNCPPNPQGHYLVSQPRFSDVQLISPMAPPNHSFLRGYDHSSYPVYRMHLNAGQIRSTIERPCAPPQTMQMDRFCAPPHILHMDRPNAPPHSSHMDQLSVPQHSLHMDRPSAPQPGGTSHSLDMDWPRAPLHNQHMGRSNAPPLSPLPDRPLDYSQHRSPVTSFGQPQGQPDALRASLARDSPVEHGNPNNSSTMNSHPQRITSSPAVGNIVNPVPPCNAVCNSLKRCRSDTPPINQSASSYYKEDGKAAVEMDLCKKRVKIELEREGASSCQSLTSPPMPVINNVFSLAPYRAYLEAAGMLPLLGPQGPQKIEKPEECALQAESHIQESDHQEDGEKPVLSLFFSEVKPAVVPDTSKEKPDVDMLELKTIKNEPHDTDGTFEDVKQADTVEIKVKKEAAERDSFVNGLMLVIKKCDPDELKSKPLKSAKSEFLSENIVDPLLTQESVRPFIYSSTPQPHRWTVSSDPKMVAPPQQLEGKPDLQKIPPQSLKLSTYKIILPDGLRAAPATLQPAERHQPPAEADGKPGAGDLRPARQHFMELHQALCRLLSNSVSQSPKQELRSWLSKRENTEPPSAATKGQNLCGLMGAKAREIWLGDEEIRCSLQKVLRRLTEYITQQYCPFPHVMRTGAVFVPMLVVKEILFPQVQGRLIDQVLQEHKVELRPTTLTEERTLIQLHKRACSSKLRRLLSLKNLPEIYLDVLNLFFHSRVCKCLGVEPDRSARKGQEEGLKEVDSSRSWSCSQITFSCASNPDTKKHRKEVKRGLRLKKHQIKRGRKSSSMHTFKKRNPLLHRAVEHAEQAENCVKASTFDVEAWNGCPVSSSENGGSEHMEMEEDLSVISTNEEDPENSWKCPLTSDDFPSSPSDNETERASTQFHHNQSSGSDQSQGLRKSPSGMILKLRRVLFHQGSKRREACYQAVSDPELHCQPPLSKAEDKKRRKASNIVREWDLSWKMSSTIPQRGQQAGRYSCALRPTRRSAKRFCVRRSLMKIKYCPYLSACHSAEHRRRWVLRSAVQRARRAMKMYFPDLVGKRIQHLYEEMDKTEVWYKGLVVRVHESHPNPLKTVFEVKYDSEPEWQYYLELLIDYQKGWLKIDD